MTKAFRNQLETLKAAAYELQLSSKNARNKALRIMRRELLENIPQILKANAKDLKKMNPSDPLYDRLQLTEERIKAMSKDLQTVLKLPDPLNQILEKRKTKSGLKLKKVSVPIGVIGVIYEARPNVTIDISALCLKSGNGVLLRGSKSAYESNKALVKVIQGALKKAGFPPKAIQLLEPDRKLVKEMMTANDYLDLIIPRGGQSLIQRVRKDSTVPTIETGASVVHTYVDKSADLRMALDIIHNEKTRRPSVCNSLDTILLHKSLKEALLPQLADKMRESQTVIHADKACYDILRHYYDQDLLTKDAPKHYAQEFLGLEMNIRIVKDLDEAIAHIRSYSLKHSESIVTGTKTHARRFEREVDAACVYVNTSTAFSDGAQFGLGAEVGISTQKTHARGPMGLQELTIYKWLIESKGKTRP